MRKNVLFAIFMALPLPLAISPPALAAPHNVIIFVADGLRYGSVTPERAPNMDRLKRQGVDFTNSHALYPTLTTVNASVIATGHYVGDTGDFANAIYAGFPVMADHRSTIPFLEDDTILAELNAHFGGNYLHEKGLLAAASEAGFQTAAIGKLGPTRIQALTSADPGGKTIIIDDATGHADGLALPSAYSAAMKAAQLPADAPDITIPNLTQEVYFARAATDVVLPRFQENGKPFVMVFWSRDPDASQHGTLDSVGAYTPGIDGPTGEAGVRDADTQLGTILTALKQLGLDKTTDVFVTADHGFATIARTSATSYAAHMTGNSDVPIRELPIGFLSIDIAAALHLPLFDPQEQYQRIDYANGQTPKHTATYIGPDPSHPDIIVVPNGGSALIYLPGKDMKERARAVVSALMREDYVSGLFVNDTLGEIPGTLPMSAIGLMGTALTPRPAIYMNFRSFATPCPDPLMCTVEITDSPLKTGQGMHGSFSRAETRNFMAAIGPDFKAGFADFAPVSNADITPTMAHILGISIPAKGHLKGRIISEALAGGSQVAVSRKTIESQPGPDGLKTVLDEQWVGDTRYFDAAGFPGRTVGLSSP